MSRSALQAPLHDVRAHGSPAALRRQEGRPARAVQPRQDSNRPAQGVREAADLRGAHGKCRRRYRARTLRARRERGSLDDRRGAADGGAAQTRSGRLHSFCQRLPLVPRYRELPRRTRAASVTSRAMTPLVRVGVARLPQSEGLPLPAYMSDHAAGADLCAAVDDELILQPGERALVPTGLAIALPAGYEA